MKKRAVILAAIVAIAGGAYFTRSLVVSARVPEPIAAATTSPRDNAGPAPTTAGEPAPTAQRSPQTMDDPRIANVRTEADLASYMDVLEREARDRGRVDDELARASQAGKRALDAHADGDHVALKMQDFGERLFHLKRELELKPVVAELDALSAQIAKERDPAARDKLVAQYNAASRKLPPPNRIGAEEHLKQVLGAR